jgi:hypothetical protein
MRTFTTNAALLPTHFFLVEHSHKGNENENSEEDFAHSHLNEAASQHSKR